MVNLEEHVSILPQDSLFSIVIYIMKAKAILHHANFYLRWVANFDREVRKFKKKSHKKFLFGHVEHRFDNSPEKSFLKVRKNLEINKLSK